MRFDSLKAALRQLIATLDSLHTEAGVIHTGITLSITAKISYQKLTDKKRFTAEESAAPWERHISFKG